MDLVTEEDLASPGVLDCYRQAAEFANKVMMHVISNLKEGDTVLSVCTHADKMIEELCSQVYQKLQPHEKGIAFPTCVSVNNCFGNFSPLPDDPAVVLKAGDLVKIELGVHINGHMSLCAHSLVLGQNPSTTTPATGRLADVICAAHFAAESILKLMRPGNSSAEIPGAVQAVADVFKCQPVEGVVSRRLKKNVVETPEVIPNKAPLKYTPFKFEMNEAYTVDVVMSTGTGKTRNTVTRTTVHRRAPGVTYILKNQTSRQLFHDITKSYPVMPFTLRSFDPKKAKIGITEMVNHNLMIPYPVTWENNGELIAQFKFTVVLLPSGTQRLNAFPLPFVSSQYTVDSNLQIKTLLSQPDGISQTSFSAGESRGQPAQKERRKSQRRSKSRGARGDQMDVDDQ